MQTVILLRQISNLANVVLFFSDLAKIRKKFPINSYPDLSNKCRTLCEEYDRTIFDAIKSDRAIGIEKYLEGPLLICHELFEAGCNDKDTRRLVFFFSNCNNRI